MAPISQKTILYSVIGGLGPTLLWLWFWVRETKGKRVPIGLIFFTFCFGMIAVIFIIPIQKLAQVIFLNNTHLIVAWAIAEEIAKYFAVATLALHSKYVERPIDYVLYFIVAGLGFAAMENILFLIEPFSTNQTTVGLLTGQLRFLGSTILHAVATGFIGISMGLAMNKGPFLKFLYGTTGIMIAITLHSIFNFFIMKSNGATTLQIFAFLWATVVFMLLIIEKLRRMSKLLN